MSQSSTDDSIETTGGRISVSEIHERCRVLEPGIVSVREAPHSNALVFHVFIERVLELAAPYERFAVINDLTEATTRPRREHLDAIVAAINGVGVHWAIVQPGSAFLRTVTRFVLARVARGGGRVSVHDAKSTAVIAAREALRS